MFDLYELMQYPSPFPRRLVGVYSDPESLIRDLSLTKSELDEITSGNVVRKDTDRDRYYELELSPVFVRRLEVEHLATMNPDGYKELEIADLSDVTEKAVYLSLKRAYTRMERRGQLKTFLLNMRKYRLIRNYGHTECTITITENRKIPPE